MSTKQEIWPTSLFGFGSAARSLFEDDYNTANSIRVKTTNDAGLSMICEGDLTPKGAQGSWTAVLPPYLDKLRIKTDGRIAAEGSFILKSTPDIDTRIYVSVEDGRQEPGKPLKSFGKAGSRLKSKTFDIDASVDLVNGPTLRTAFLWRPSKTSLTVGMEAQVNTHWEEKHQLSSGSELEDLNVAAAYTTPNWSLSGRTSERLGTITAAYLHTLSPSLTLGTQLQYGLKANVQKMLLGVRWDLDDVTTVKGKLDSSAMVCGTYSHKLTKYSTVTLCASIDSKDLASDNHRVGVGLSFE